MSTNTRIGLKRYIKDNGENKVTQAVVHQNSIEVWGRRIVLLIVLVWAISPLIGFLSSLIILSVTGIVIAVLGLRWPALGLLGIGMFTTLEALTRKFFLTGGILRHNTFNYWLLIVIILFLPFVLRLNDPHSRILQIFIFLLILQLLISPDPMIGIQEILNIVTFFGLVVYFARALQDKMSYYWLGIVNGTLAAIGGLIYSMQIDSLPYIDPNSWIYFPLMGLFSICMGIHSANKYRRGVLVLLLLAAINFIWIFLSGSRGGLVNGLVCMIYLFLAIRNLTWRTFFLIVVGALSIWFSSQFIMQQTRAFERYAKTFDTSYTLASRTSGRSRLAEAGFTLFLENPLGVGTGGFREEASKLEIMDQRVQPAHSAWITSLAENGFIGFILLFAYVVSFAVVGWNKKDRNMFLLGLLVTFNFAIAFMTTEYSGKNLWFLAAGVTVLLHQKEIKQQLDKLTQHRLVRTGFRSRLKSRYRRSG